ncbi:hypothetical protein [Streptomyces boninensis]|uniref:hypothetical protein n=1 Tax=Streptomyces boninensis TaxID=2039455 RepID=UPI003B20C68B
MTTNLLRWPTVVIGGDEGHRAVVTRLAQPPDAAAAADMPTDEGAAVALGLMRSARPQRHGQRHRREHDQVPNRASAAPTRPTSSAPVTRCAAMDQRARRDARTDEPKATKLGPPLRRATLDPDLLSLFAVA